MAELLTIRRKTLINQSIIMKYFYHTMKYFHTLKLIQSYVYCKDQRNAAVIILRYTKIRHNGICVVSSYTSLLLAHCENTICILDSKS